MTDNMQESIQYYREPGEITRLDRYQAFTSRLSADPGAIYQVAQGLLVHDRWVSAYGAVYDQSHAYPQKIAYMEDLLDKALELDTSSLALPRRAADRVIACCREFATLMCALLRAKGIPARSRCGFAAYFGWTGVYEDHWICEYHDGSRWVMADPQLDPLQQSSVMEWGLASQQDPKKVLAFTPRDLKEDEFLPAGKVWSLCRSGEIDPEKCGISCPIRPEWGIDSLYGLWFVRGQLLRDFAALNKVETVPYLVRIAKGLDWNPWRLVAATDDQLSEEDWQMLDQIAELSLAPDDNLSSIRQTYTAYPDLQAPDEILRR